MAAQTETVIRLQKYINKKLIGYIEAENSLHELSLGIANDILLTPLKKDRSVLLNEHLDIQIESMDKQFVCLSSVGKSPFGEQVALGIVKKLVLAMANQPPVKSDEVESKQTETAANYDSDVIETVAIADDMAAQKGSEEDIPQIEVVSLAEESDATKLETDDDGSEEMQITGPFQPVECQVKVDERKPVEIEAEVDASQSDDDEIEQIDAEESSGNSKVDIELADTGNAADSAERFDQAEVIQGKSSSKSESEVAGTDPTEYRGNTKQKAENGHLANNGKSGNSTKMRNMYYNRDSRKVPKKPESNGKNAFTKSKQIVLLTIVVIIACASFVIYTSPGRSLAEARGGGKISKVFNNISILQVHKSEYPTVHERLKVQGDNIDNITYEYGQKKARIEDWIVQKVNVSAENESLMPKSQKISVEFNSPLSDKNGKGTKRDLVSSYPVFKYRYLLKTHPSVLIDSGWQKSGNRLSKAGENYEVNLTLSAEENRVVSVMYTIDDTRQYAARDFGVILGLYFNTDYRNFEKRGNNRCVVREDIYSRRIEQDDSQSRKGRSYSSRRYRRFKRLSKKRILERFKAEYCFSPKSAHKWISIHATREKY